MKRVYSLAYLTSCLVTPPEAMQLAADMGYQQVGFRLLPNMPGLLKQLAPLIPVAKHNNIILAIENHIDLLAGELVDFLTTLNSEWIGVCLDTANNLRLFEHPVEVAQKLAPWTRATHVKDVVAQRGDPRTFAFWPSVPVGDGLVEIPKILDILRAQNYQGLLAVEIDYLHPSYPDDEAALAKSLSYLRGLF